MHICYLIRQLSTLSCERFMLRLKHIIKTQPLINGNFEKFKVWDVYYLNYFKMSASKNPKPKKRKAEVENFKKSTPIKKSVVVKCLQDMRSVFECTEEKPKMVVQNRKPAKIVSVVKCLDDMKSNFVPAESNDTDTVDIPRIKKTISCKFPIAARSLRCQRNATASTQDTNVSTNITKRESFKNLANPEDKSTMKNNGNTITIKSEENSEANPVEIKQEIVEIKEEPYSPVKEKQSSLTAKKGRRSHIKLEYDEVKKVKVVKILFYYFI